MADPKRAAAKRGLRATIAIWQPSANRQRLGDVKALNDLSIKYCRGAHELGGEKTVSTASVLTRRHFPPTRAPAILYCKDDLLLALHMSQSNKRRETIFDHVNGHSVHP